MRLFRKVKIADTNKHGFRHISTELKQEHFLSPGDILYLRLSFYH